MRSATKKERAELTWWAVRVNPLDSEKVICGSCKSSGEWLAEKYGGGAFSGVLRNWGIPEGYKCPQCGEGER